MKYCVDNPVCSFWLEQKPLWNVKDNKARKAIWEDIQVAEHQELQLSTEERVLVFGKWERKTSVHVIPADAKSM